MRNFFNYCLFVFCVLIGTWFVIDYAETRQTAFQAWEWHISFAAPEIGKLRAQDSMNKADLEREIFWLKKRVAELEKK
jgi:hypothetical protein